MRWGFVAAIAASTLCFVYSANADPAYKADAVIKTFTQPALGKARAVCVGDETECPVKTEQPTFDLLVTFDFNSDRLTQSARENLDQFAIALKDPRLKTQRFAIDGHTDATGSESYNFGLSERRARAVVAYLATKGLDASKLIAKGFGKSKPRVSDPFDPVNRRVETRLDQ
jgi:outer membrane protein OmpA-like peptidoglycan-associated protein